MRLIIPRRLASEGEELPPWFYGLAYIDFLRHRSIYYPMPLHLVARFVRWCHYQWEDLRDRPGPLDRYIAGLQRQSWERGFSQGVRSGRAETSSDAYKRGFHEGRQQRDWEIETTFAMTLDEMARERTEREASDESQPHDENKDHPASADIGGEGDSEGP